MAKEVSKTLNNEAFTERNKIRDSLLSLIEIEVEKVITQKMSQEEEEEELEEIQPQQPRQEDRSG